MMNWLIKIEGQKNQILRVVFNPTLETITITAECRLKNNLNNWVVFSKMDCIMSLSLDELKTCIEVVLDKMNKRIDAYKNLDETFSLLKEVGYINTDEDEVLVMKNNNSDIVYGSLEDEIT